MLTKDGCRRRLQRFRESLDGSWDAALIHRSEHLLYLANFYPLPNSLNLESASFLLVERDGPATLYTDNWLAGDLVAQPASETSSADRVDVVEWYACHGPARLRARAVAEAVRQRLDALQVERLFAETAHVPFDAVAGVRQLRDCEPALRRLRRVKDSDEVDAIRRGIGTAEAMHRASRRLLEPGRTEIEYYALLLEEGVAAAGSPFVMMGDLASGPRAATGGGAPTARRIQAGELVILDFFPYVEGYRGDITNTLVAGGKPSAAQLEVFALVRDALADAEERLRPGTPVREFHDVIQRRFQSAPGGHSLVHHAGHAIGLSHPEAPELVAESDDSLEAGMVITLEPGIYGLETGGIRLEHDYLVTPSGYERLSSHELSLV